jgi:hypothetical protein
MAANSLRHTQEGTMAKINVKGGSDLEIKFTDDSEDVLTNLQLEKIGNNWFRVKNLGPEPDPRPFGWPYLQAVKVMPPPTPAPSTVFRASGNAVKVIEIGYRDTMPSP